MCAWPSTAWGGFGLVSSQFATGWSRIASEESSQGLGHPGNLARSFLRSPRGKARESGKCLGRKMSVYRLRPDRVGGARRGGEGNAGEETVRISGEAPATPTDRQERGQRRLEGRRAVAEEDAQEHPVRTAEATNLGRRCFGPVCAGSAHGRPPTFGHYQGRLTG